MAFPLARGEIVLTRFPFSHLAGSAVRPALIVSQGAIGQDVILVLFPVCSGVDSSPPITCWTCPIPNSARAVFALHPSSVAMRLAPLKYLISFVAWGSWAPKHKLR